MKKYIIALASTVFLISSCGGMLKDFYSFSGVDYTTMVYYGSTTGLYASNDRGENCQQILASSVSMLFAADPYNRIIASPGSAFVYQKVANSAFELIGSIGNTVHITSTPDGTFYIVGLNAAIYSLYRWRETDGFKQLTTMLGNTLVLYAVQYKGSHVLISTDTSNSCEISHDFGNTWKVPSGTLSGYYFVSAINIKNETILAGDTAQQMLKSSDGGYSFEVLSNPFGAGYQVTAMACSNKGRIFIGSNDATGRLYYSDGDLNSWTPTSSFGPYTVFSLNIDSGGRLYVGGTGVFYSDDSGASFHQAGGTSTLSVSKIQVVEYYKD